MNIQWDADRYASNFSFVPRYGSSALELLDIAPGSSVLDLGCGNGALTEALREKGFAAIGLDASTELLEVARRDHPDIEFLPGDATDFALPEPVDAVFSNAVFHWIDAERQPDMLRCVHDALKPGGQFVFEFGGHGNNRRIHATLANAFARRGYTYEMPFYFPTVGEYANLLEAAGFRVAFAALFDRPTELVGPDGLKEWIRMFVKTPFAIISSEAEREAILDQVADDLRSELCVNGKWYADYVRLRMKALRAE